MGILTQLCPPLFRQSRYIRPSGHEIFESPFINAIKSPYMTGALCGTFYQAATDAPFSGLIPIALGYGLAHVLKSFDNDGALQLRQSTIPKIIDKRPNENIPLTSHSLMNYAKERLANSQKWLSVFTAITLFDAFMKARHGDNPLYAFNPVSIGLISDQTMRYMRFRQITNGYWIMHDKAPKQDEPLYPIRQL